MAIYNREARKITIGEPHNESGLPRLSLVMSREDGQHTSLTVFPTDDEVRTMSEDQFIDKHVKPMLEFARRRYRGEIT